MSNRFDDRMAISVGRRLAFCGSQYSYSRGARTSAGVLMRDSTGTNESINENGQYVNTKDHDFIILTADLPFGDPLAGDLITDGIETYKVVPRGDEQPFRRSNPTQTRIFTVQIK